MLRGIGRRPDYAKMAVLPLALILSLTAMSSLLLSVSPPSLAGPGMFNPSSEETLYSWNPNVSCTPALITMQDILAPHYPGQDVNDTRYEMEGIREDTGGPLGGVPHKSDLDPPCTVTNVTGQTHPTLVQINDVYLSTWYVQDGECSDHFKGVNGGGPYPNGTLCDNQGEFLPMGSTVAFMQGEMDQDWLAAGFCGPAVASCDNVTIGDWVSAGTLSLDLQGFVYWDGENWELHPMTGARLSLGFVVDIEPATLETTRTYTAPAPVRVLGSSADPVSLSVSGCPANAACTFSLASGAPAYKSILQIDPSPTSPTGTFVLVVSATNATLTRTAELNLTIGDRVVLSYEQRDGGAFSETDDTYLDSIAPTTNRGSGLKLHVDNADCIGVDGSVCRSLLKYPNLIGTGVGQVPLGSLILGGTLELTITNSGGAQTAFRVLEAWGEMNATWNSFSPAGSPQVDPTGVTYETPVGKVAVNVTSFVAQWADGNANHGVFLRTSSGDGAHFDSSESTTPPRLTVQFVPPPVVGAILSYDMESLLPDGRMEDLSGHENHGTIAGASDVTGLVGRARQFDGIDDYLEVPDSSSFHVANEITIAAWVYLEADHTGGLPTMIRKQGSFLLELGDGGTNRPTFLLWWTDGSAGPILSGPPIAKFDWHHWAATYDGAQMRIYIDGRESGSLGITKTMAPTPDPLRLGKWNTESFAGVIDQIHIFPQALTGQEIADLAFDPDVVLTYDMENLTADGRMKDLSGHGNHGTISGPTDVMGKVGRARQFDGIADYVEVPDSSSLHVSAGITIAAWVYIEADHPNGTATMIRKQGSFLLELGDSGTNQPTFFLWWSDGSTGPLLSGPAVAKFEWHHLAATYDGTSIRLYVDGAEVGSALVSKTIASSVESVRLGKWETEWFKGTLDEVQFFSRPLGASEIAALVPPSEEPPPSSPVVSFDMENLTTDGRMKDLSGRGNHGIISGASDVAGSIGRARQFDGIDDYIEVPDSSDLHVSGGITIASWVYLQADHADGTATMIRKQGSFLFELGDEGTNRPSFFLWWSDGSAGPLLSGPPVAKFEWHHLAATYNGTSMRLYVDGIEVGSVLISKTIATSLEPLRIGHWATEWFAGIIDEVRIFSRALTGAEIAGLASSNSTVIALAHGPAHRLDTAVSDGFPGIIPSELGAVTSSSSIRFARFQSDY